MIKAKSVSQVGKRGLASWARAIRRPGLAMEACTCAEGPCPSARRLERMAAEPPSSMTCMAAFQSACKL